MVGRKNQVVNQIVSLLNKDPSNIVHFFSKEKSSKWLEILEPYGFFKPDRVKSVVQEDNSIDFPSWSQGIYLKKIASQISSEEIYDTQTIELFLKIIRNLVGANKDIWMARDIFKIFFLLPVKHIAVNDVSNCFSMIEDFAKEHGFIKIDVQDSYFKILSSVKNNPHDRSIFKEFVKNLLKSHDDETDLREKKLIYFQSHCFKDLEDKFLKFEEQYKEKEFSLEDAVDVIAESLNEILEIEDVDESSNSWRPAIESHYQNKYHDSAPSILIETLYKIINFLITKKRTPSLIESWKKSDKITFSRIYIALTTDNPIHLKIDECATRILSLGLKKSFRHEVYRFLQKHFDDLDSDIQTSILDEIEKLADNSSDDKRRLLFTAYEKLRWIQAIKNSKNKRVEKLYEDNFKLTGSEAEYPDFDSFIGPTFIGPKSPWSVDDFHRASSEEIIEKLTSYQDNERSFGEPSIEGLSHTFESYVAQYPLKCSGLISEMLQMQRVYLSSIFGGYIKARAEEKFVPVEELLGLGLSALSDEQFKNDLSDKDSKARWAVTLIFRFISTGVLDDKNAFDPKFNSKCHEILKKSVTLVKPSKEYQGSSDARTRAINEPRGVLFEAAIHLALREARLEYDESSKKPKDIKKFKKAWSGLYQIIEEPLKSQSCDEISLHAHLGSLYRQLLFLNKEWLYSNLDLVCPPGDEKSLLRSAFIQGYCYVNVYIKKMYTQLYTRGYLLEFLRDSDEESKNSGSGSRINILQERVISLATIAFLLGDEDLEKGLFKEILNDENAEEWRMIIRALPRLVGEEPDKIIFKNAIIIIEFMIKKFNLSKKQETLKKHLGGFGQLLKIFKNPNDKIVENIISIALFCTSGQWNYSVVIKYLYNYRDTHTEIVGELFYKLFDDKNDCPSYPEDKIIDICKSLKNSGKSELLAKICHIYSNKLPHSEPTKAINDILRLKG